MPKAMNPNLTESIYQSNMRSILPSTIGTMPTETSTQEEINEQEIDVKITDVADFLSNLKDENFNYIDLSEVNKRRSKTKSKLSASRSGMNFSKNFGTSSRIGGLGSSTNTKISMLLNKKRNLGNLGSKRMDIREKIKNLKLNKDK